MADTFELELATPERLLLREAVTEAQIPALNGFIGVLPGHAPLLAELGTGYAVYQAGGRRHYMALNGGFVEVQADKVRVLADTAENAEEIDVQRAEAALQRAQERLAHATVGIDIGRALNALHRAEARLEAARRAG